MKLKYKVSYSQLRESTWEIREYPDRRITRITVLQDRDVLTHTELEELIVLSGDTGYVNGLRERAREVMQGYPLE